MRNIDFIREIAIAATDKWYLILAKMNINVPASPQAQVACPACEGKDRFRFDNKDGRGTHICNRCGAGDGLELVRKVFNVSTTEAAKSVAEVLDIDYQALINTTSTSQKKVQQQAERKQREQERQERDTTVAEQRRKDFTRRYTAMCEKTKQGESEYLKNKGLDGFNYPVLPDGLLLLGLVDEHDTVTAAQTITAIGNKRLLVDSSPKGAYHAVNELDAPEVVIISEGLATALSVHMIRPDALTVCAVSAGNLTHVANVMRSKYHQTQIIIAADNDHRTDGTTNTGKVKAEAAAQSVCGWVSMPQTDHKADWNDYHQQHGLEASALAFNESIYQPEVQTMRPQLKIVEGGKKHRSSGHSDIAQMAASQKAKLLSGHWDVLAVNPDSGGVYCYSAGVWEKLGDSELERVMVSIFEEHEAHYTEKGIKSVVATMKLQLPAIGEQRADLIGFKNGVYDLTAKAFAHHSADNWLMNHNGITYTDPKLGENLQDHAPNFTRWITHATAGNHQKADRISAALFMVLAKRHDWQLFIEVTGEGGSGKSIFSNIAITLAGEHNTASGSMSTLDLARGRAQFVGKSLITMPDQTRYVGEGAGIKAITGGDPVEIDGKYEKQFTTVLNAVVLATNNEPMTFTERNGGIARRRVIFPFNNIVSESEKDVNLIDRIRSEIPVIIRYLLTLFTDQNKAKKLLIEQRESLEALEVKRGTDPVIDMCAALFFMDEPTGLMMGGGTWAGQPEPRSYLYHLYLAFVEYHGLGKPLSVNKFSRAIKSAAKEYSTAYLTRQINGRAQTNVKLTELVDEFLPRAFGCPVPDNNDE